MEPIINSWAIYWINVLSNIKIAAIITFIIAIVTIVIELGLYFCSYGEWEEKEEKDCKKITFFLGIIIAITVFIFIFIPEKEDMYTMFVLNYVTPDNINLGIEGVKSIFEYIVDTAAELSAE